MNNKMENEITFKKLKDKFVGLIQSKIISSGQIKYKELLEAVKEYRELGYEIQRILEYMAHDSKADDKKKIWNLYLQFSQESVGNTAESLIDLGIELKGDPSYTNVVNDLLGQSFRILERTRHGQRSEVQYMITRIFIANKKQIPYLLSKAFNPIYPDEIFKTFIYSFLSGVLSTKQKGGEE